MLGLVDNRAYYKLFIQSDSSSLYCNGYFFFNEIETSSFKNLIFCIQIAIVSIKKGHLYQDFFLCIK